MMGRNSRLTRLVAVATISWRSCSKNYVSRAISGMSMIVDWGHAWPTVTAAFFASLVEFVEALTVVLAVGAVRGWSGALLGTGGAVAVLLAIAVVLGPALAQIPLAEVQLVVGVLLLLFGMRWLRKAILRAAGVIALHDEVLAFAKETESLRRLGGGAQRWDAIAIATAFKITMLEGLEVIFIVIAVGAGGVGLLAPASVGALAALLLVAILGVIVHKPLSAIPENTLKFIVGVLLSAFGTFWVGEGLDLGWPREDWSILGLTIAFLVVALAAVPLCRGAAAARGSLRTR
jgi:Ca2+/H+ antiporter, TMEM165/GDT1 family